MENYSILSESETSHAAHVPRKIIMSDYYAYLIRLWRDDKQQPWRAELVSPHGGETRRFATPEQLFHFVQQQIDSDHQPTAKIATPTT